MLGVSENKPEVIRLSNSAILIRTYADMLNEGWYFDGKLGEDDKRDNALVFAGKLSQHLPFKSLSTARLYETICRSLNVEPYEGDTDE